jgi:hypothetical protein
VISFHFCGINIVLLKEILIMKTQKFLALIAILILSTSLLFTACQKDISASNTIVPAGTQSVAIYLNDDPANYYKVLVDIQQIEIKVDTGSQHHDDNYYETDEDNDDDHNGHDNFGQWDTLNVKPGLYDLLQLRNGVDTLIASGYPLVGKISKIRITLGSSSTVFTDSANSFPLSICNNKPYVYVKTNSNTIDTLPGGIIKLRIDFDIAKSIKFKDGIYCLKPELKAYCDKNTGSIEGKIYPKDAIATVTVFNETDTAYAMPWHEGEYKIKGLKAGVYSAKFSATSPYMDTTITGIIVNRGRETKLGNTILRK